MEEVILVDENDHPVGTMEKILAHQKGVLHRAFSVLIFNSQNELLLQKRAFHKYHSPGLWTNTCCSHPRPGETVVEAAQRRLMEEMGLNCKTEIAGSFIYKVKFDENLFEHEFDYVLKGFTDNIPLINKDEVAEFKYISVEELKKRMIEAPNEFTFWFHEILKHSYI